MASLDIGRLISLKDEGESHWRVCVCVLLPLSQIRDCPETEIQPSKTDKPPPSVYVVGGSAVFHKPMNILFLLVKCKDKSCCRRGFSHAAKATRQKESHVGVWRGGLQPSGER